MWGAMCREGTAQSPININTSASPLRSAPDVRFQFNYASSVRSIANTGARVHFPLRSSATQREPFRPPLLSPSVALSCWLP